MFIIFSVDLPVKNFSGSPVVTPPERVRQGPSTRLRSYGGVERSTNARRPFGGVDGLSRVDRACVHIAVYHEVIVAPAWPGAVGGLLSMDTDPSHEQDARISWPNSRSRSALAEARMCGASAAATTSS